MNVETPQSALNKLSEGIALLIDLAKRGEIDPWDVQVIEVIDRYLSQLTPQQNYSSPGQNFTELSQSGQAFLYASMLVLLKADSLMSVDPLEADAEITVEEEFVGGEDGLNGLQRPQNLERQIRRRTVGKTPQKRRVTLQELIDQLQLMATAIAEQKTRPKRRRTSSTAKAQAAKAIAELAHQENLTETATKLEQLLSDRWSNLSDQWLDLEQLLVLWSNAISPENLASESSDDGNNPENLVHQPRNERVGVFWALLLLSAQSKVELTQEEFYKDIKVRTLPTSDSV
ncbi:segregation/condensation protein A [Capilliphycus salinus ALCB114379]|uniref:segregation/condensation protein A n=1 Tax=Capilliphycus salinus TaxID=2768948 RepID=UPI0039A6253B